MPVSPAAATSAGTTGRWGTNWFRGTAPCSGFDNPQSAPASPFWYQTFGAGFAKIVVVLGTGVPVILASLMIGIDQSIVAERRQTFGEAVDGALLCGGEHF